MIKGKAITFGNNIDTDQIIGAHLLSLPSIEAMAPHAFAHHERFAGHFQPGDIVVAKDNFGCGSSREQAPAVLKERGVAAVVARSFARIFFRNAINQGLPVFICPQADEINHLDELEIAGGCLHHLATERRYGIEPLPAFLQAIVDDGGIIAHLRQEKKEPKRTSTPPK